GLGLARPRLATARVGLADLCDRAGARLAAQVRAGAIADGRDRGQPWAHARGPDAAPVGVARVELQTVAQGQARAAILEAGALGIARLGQALGDHRGVAVDLAGELGHAALESSTAGRADRGRVDLFVNRLDLGRI